MTPGTKINEIETVPLVATVPTVHTGSWYTFQR